MEALSVKDYRNNLSASFDRADEGERVIIRRRNSLYALVSLGKEDISLSSTKQQQMDEMARSLKRSWEQVKQMEAGNIPEKSALDFIDEL